MRRNILLLTEVILLLCIVGTCIYFVGGVSATLPPIEKFEYEGNMQGIMVKIKALETINPNLTVNFSDILGNKFNGFAYDIQLKIKYNSHDLLYDIKIQSESREASKGELLLIGAHDLTNDTGGYGVGANGIKILLKRFMSDIITPLKEKGVTMTLLQ